MRGPSRGNALSLFTFIAVMLCIGLGGGFYLLRLQKGLFDIPGSILFVPSGAACGTIFISAIFLAIPLAGLALLLLSYRFPSWFFVDEVGRYETNVRYASDYVKYRNGLLAAAILIGLAAAPLGVFAVTSYTVITDTGGRYCRFWSVHPADFSWEDVREVRTVCHTTSKSLALGYVLCLEDGFCADLWNTARFLERIDLIDGILVRRGVPFRTEPPSPAAVRKLERRFSGRLLEKVKRILRIS